MSCLIVLDSPEEAVAIIQEHFDNSSVDEVLARIFIVKWWTYRSSDATDGNPSLPFDAALEMGATVPQPSQTQCSCVSPFQVGSLIVTGQLRDQPASRACTLLQ